MAGTISTTLTSGYTLTTSPTSALSSGALIVMLTSGFAVYGPGGTAWTLINQLLIDNFDPPVTTLSGDGTEILGFGVGLHDGGFVSNAAHGTMSAYSNALLITGGRGTVTNYGLIRSTEYDNGVKFLDITGTLTNAGTVSGASYGVYFFWSIVRYCCKFRHDPGRARRSRNDDGLRCGDRQ